MNSFLSLVSFTDVTTGKHIDHGEVTHDSFQQLNDIHPSDVKDGAVVKYQNASFRVVNVDRIPFDSDIAYDFSVVPV